MRALSLRISERQNSLFALLAVYTTLIKSRSQEGDQEFSAVFYRFLSKHFEPPKIKYLLLILPETTSPKANRKHLILHPTQFSTRTCFTRSVLKTSLRSQLGSLFSTTSCLFRLQTDYPVCSVQIRKFSIQTKDILNTISVAVCMNGEDLRLLSVV
jgi:hypothetical protein